MAKGKPGDHHSSPGTKKGHHPLLGSVSSNQRLAPKHSTGVDDNASLLSNLSTISATTLSGDLSPARVIYNQPVEASFVSYGSESESSTPAARRSPKVVADLVIPTTTPVPMPKPRTRASTNGRSHSRVFSQPECVEELGAFRGSAGRKQPRLRAKSIHDPHFEAALKRHFPHQSPPASRPTFLGQIWLNANQISSTTLSTLLLIGVVLWAVFEDLLHQFSHRIIHPYGTAIFNLLARVPIESKSFRYSLKRYQKNLDRTFGPFISEHGPTLEEEEAVRLRLKGHKPTMNVDQYAEELGFRIEHHTFVTRDGFYLKMHRVILPIDEQDDTVERPPMLILHGMFQCSGAFLTNEEDSMAFRFARLGFDVWLGNNRSILGAGHEEYSRADPRFWNWNLLEMARYDFPAMITGILKATSAEKVAVVGHSQGSASAFVALSRGIDPGLGNKVSAFIALAPAVFTGPLLTGFPFKFLRTMDRRSWSRYFGDLEFLPQMDPFMEYAPVWATRYFGYLLFAWLFNWSDETWIKARKAKYFRFTPTCSSAENIFWWTGGTHAGFAYRGCIFADDKEPWFDESFPPLLSLYGQNDALCLGSKLLERLYHHEPALKGRFASIMLPGEQHMLHLSANAAKQGGLHDCMIEFLKKTGALPVTVK